MLPAVPPLATGRQCLATHRLPPGCISEVVLVLMDLMGAGPESPGSLEEAPLQHG